ncbi:MAG: hypothetical protein FWB90_02515 [Fibromonadales bacterium]|nr:hypothetical protein [Fibromonadales bacterium]
METLYLLWFASLIFFLVVLFVAKLKFDKIFERREDRRRMLSYSKSKLVPTEEGQARALRIRRVTS